MTPTAAPEGPTPANAPAPGPTDLMVADVFQRDCTSRAALEAVTGRWGVLTVAGLRDGAVRFNALRRRVDGVSEKMLAQTLQALERDGVVVREVRTTIPPHVEYSLTDLGQRVADRLLALIEVLEGAVPEVAAAQERYDAARVAASSGGSSGRSSGRSPGTTSDAGSRSAS